LKTEIRDISEGFFKLNLPKVISHFWGTSDTDIKHIAFTISLRTSVSFVKP